MASFKIIIDHSKVAADLTDFPVYIDLADMPSGFWSTATNGGGDIRCYDINDNELAREVVSCDTTLQSGELHIKADVSSTVGTILKVVVDGVSSEYAPTDPFGRNAVWSNNYLGVWHLDDLSDSTVNGSDWSMLGSPTPSSGVLGDCYNFNGSGAGLTIANGALFKTSEFTWQIWALSNTPQSPSEIIGLHESGNSSYGSSIVRGASTANYYFKAGGQDLQLYPSANIWDGEWHLLSFTCASISGPGIAYEDGVNVASGIRHTNFTSQTVPLTIARSNDGYWGDYIGDIDEVRVSSVVRSPERISTEYNNQSSPVTFYTIEDFIQAPIPYSDGYAYMYENVGYNAPNSSEGYGYSYENVGYFAPNSGEGYGYSYENVGYNAPNSGEGYGYSYENVTLYVINNDNMLPPIIS